MPDIEPAELTFPNGLSYLAGPPARPEHVQTNWTVENLDEKRDELFKIGSEFMPTARTDIVGIDNVLLEIDDVVHTLINHEKYSALGARLEPGVIFEGDPGTGKTLVSRYIATASNALFINVRDFPHLGSLYSDADIRDLFRRARKAYAEIGHPVILFWDEFENGARDRADATPEQVATVSQITAELDGIHGKNAGLLLVGCTNYTYNIDPALKRAGRMGLHIEFSPPDRAGKQTLLEHYLNKRVIDTDIDCDTLSYFFDTKATAADIEEATVEAWRYAVRRSLGEDPEPCRLTQQDLVAVFLKRLVGPPTAFVNLPQEDLERIAVHECGHALMALVYGIPLRLVTVQPGKKSLGRVITAEVREHIGTVDEMMSKLRVAVGSIVAEELAGVPALVGSTSDIQHLNALATDLVNNLKAGERTALYNAAVVADHTSGRMSNNEVSDTYKHKLDDDIATILRTVYDDAFLSMGRIGSEAIWEIAREVTRRITLTGGEFRDLFIEVADFDPESVR